MRAHFQLLRWRLLSSYRLVISITLVVALSRLALPWPTPLSEHCCCDQTLEASLGMEASRGAAASALASAPEQRRSHGDCPDDSDCSHCPCRSPAPALAVGEPLQLSGLQFLPDQFIPNQLMPDRERQTTLDSIFRPPRT